MGTAAGPGDTGLAPTVGAASDRPADYRTFLIADIRGYTSYTDEHGDEAAAELTDDGRLYLPDTGNNRVVVFQLQQPLWPPP